MRPVEMLLVEDSPGDVALLRNYLTQSRYSIRLSVAGDGEEALGFLRRSGEFAASAKPDLVLLDLKLPKISGQDVLAEMKKDPLLSEIPVLIMSNFWHEQELAPAGDQKANTYIWKPEEEADYSKLVKYIDDHWIRKILTPGK
jgi:CheY-like chemotaxis protein